jgi:glycerol-3-phosphate dehydrogenase
VRALSSGEVAADVAIIGAGVVGLAVAHRLSKQGLHVVVIEKEPGPGMGVTSGQANVIHVIQLPFGSLKSKLARKGNTMYDDLCRDLGVKLTRVPSLLVVRGWLRLPALAAVWAYLKLELRGEFKVRIMRGGNLRKLEPLLSDDITGGVVVDGYGTVDVNALVAGLKSASEKQGASFLFGCKMLSARREGGLTLLSTTRGNVSARIVVNAAGLYSDDVAVALGKSLGTLEPGLGVMAVYTGLDLHCIVAPLPLSVGSRTKGGAIIPATDGTTIIGPTLRVAASKEDIAHTPEDLALLEAKFSPLLRAEGTLVRVYTGMRPLSPTRDFIIDLDKERGVVSLVGIESPGMTSAPAIAEVVERMIGESKP